MRKLFTGAMLAGALLATASIAPAAQAAPCDGVGMTQTFLDWNDKAFYALVGDGSFETGADGWTLTGGAALAAGGNPFDPTLSVTSLALPALSSAITPPICVAKGNPSARIFGQTFDRPRDASRGTLQVYVLYLDSTGALRKVKAAGKLKSERGWGPTRKFSLAEGQFKAPKPCGQAQGSPSGTDTSAEPCADSLHYSYIQLFFAPIRGTSWKIDDVYVDPRSRS